MAILQMFQLDGVPPTTGKVDLRRNLAMEKFISVGYQVGTNDEEGYQQR
jgi:hypothetical protein